MRTINTAVISKMALFQKPKQLETRSKHGRRSIPTASICKQDATVDCISVESYRFFRPKFRKACDYIAVRSMIDIAIVLCGYRWTSEHTTTTSEFGAQSSVRVKRNMEAQLNYKDQDKSSLIGRARVGVKSSKSGCYRGRDGWQISCRSAPSACELRPGPA
jgi:hypothetical protein